VQPELQVSKSVTAGCAPVIGFTKHDNGESEVAEKAALLPVSFRLVIVGVLE
jgi:hypothetical protein